VSNDAVHEPQGSVASGEGGFFGNIEHDHSMSMK